MSLVVASAGNAVCQAALEARLSKIPDTGFTEGLSSNQDAEWVANHPEGWEVIP